MYLFTHLPPSYLTGHRTYWTDSGLNKQMKILEMQEHMQQSMYSKAEHVCIKTVTEKGTNKKTKVKDASPSERDSLQDTPHQTRPRARLQTLHNNPHAAPSPTHGTHARVQWKGALGANCPRLTIFTIAGPSPALCFGVLALVVFLHHSEQETPPGGVPGH